MFYEADIDLFFWDFGEDVVYGQSTIRAIIDTNYVLALNNQGFQGIEAYDVSATVKTADVTGIKHNDTLTVRGKTYYVKGIQDTGSGTTLLFLSE